MNPQTCSKCKCKFQSGRNLLYCSAICRREVIAARSDFYVYAWYGDHWLPYYIGKGSGKRAWRNEGAKGRLLVKIIAKGLTNEAALNLEKETIELFRSQGANLVNQMNKKKIVYKFNR